MEALRADDQDNADTIEYHALDDRLVVKIQSECFKSFMKTAIFFMERFKLSSNTMALCEANQENVERIKKPVYQHAPENGIR